jgi:hypothetical protein
MFTTCGAGTSYPSETPELAPCFSEVLVAQSLSFPMVQTTYPSETHEFAPCFSEVLVAQYLSFPRVQTTYPSRET